MLPNATAKLGPFVISLALIIGIFCTTLSQHSGIVPNVMQQNTAPAPLTVGREPRMDALSRLIAACGSDMAAGYHVRTDAARCSAALSRIGTILPLSAAL